MAPNDDSYAEDSHAELECGSPIFIYSSSAGGWISAQVFDVHKGGITALYTVAGREVEKRIAFGSPNLRIPGEEKEWSDSAAPHVEVGLEGARCPIASRLAWWWYWRFGRTWVPYSSEHNSELEAAHKAGKYSAQLTRNQTLVFRDPGFASIDRQPGSPELQQYLEVCRMPIGWGIPYPDRTLRAVSFEYLVKTDVVLEEELKAGRRCGGTQMTDMREAANELKDCAPRMDWLFRMDEDFEVVFFAEVVTDARTSFNSP